MKTEMRKKNIGWKSFQTALWLLTASMILGIPAFANPERICSEIRSVELDRLLALPNSEAPPFTTTASGSAEPGEPPEDPDRDPIRLWESRPSSADAVSWQGVEAVLVTDRPGSAGAGAGWDLARPGTGRLSRPGSTRRRPPRGAAIL